MNDNTTSMNPRTFRKCDLVMLVPHLGDGGTQKVVTTLANEWNKKGRNITLVTIYDHSDDYVLNAGIKRIKMNELKVEGGFLLELISDVISLVILKITDRMEQLNSLVKSYKSQINKRFLLYSYLFLIFCFSFFIFIFNFLLVLFLMLKDLLISLISKMFHFSTYIFYYAKHVIINIISFILNVLNDFIDEFVHLLTTFKQKFGFGFFGISFYLIMAIFYIRKFFRYRYRYKFRDYWFKKKIGPYLHIFNRARAIRGVVKSENPSVVLSFIGSTNILTIIACKFLGKKVVISERNDPAIQRLNHPYEKLRPYIYKHANVITANTIGALKVMKEYVQDNKLVYVPNPLDLSISSNGYRTMKKSKSYILCVGRLHEQKAYDVLLKAFKEISPKLDNWYLVILGKGELKKIKNKYKK